MKTPEEQSETLKKYLGEPYAAEFSDTAQKVRRNLLASCFVSFLFLFGGIGIADNSSLFGLRISGLDNNLIMKGLLVLVAYQLIHFLWHSWDAMSYWRIRITGAIVQFRTDTSMGNPESESPNDPRQASLYRWWLEKSNGIQQVPVLCAQIEKLIQDSEELKSACEGNYQGLNQKLNELNITLERSQHIIEHERIPASLQRFDNWYRLMFISQGARWLIIEVTFPIVLGFASLGGLVNATI